MTAVVRLGLAAAAKTKTFTVTVRAATATAYGNETTKTFKVTVVKH